MPDLFDLLLHLPGVLDAPACERLIQAHAGEQALHGAYGESSLHAGTGRREASSFDAVSLRPGTPAFETAHAATSLAMDAWLDHLDRQGMFNVHLLRRSLRYSHDYRVLRYGEGARIHPHTDWDEFTLGSCTLALNEDYEGGEFSYFNGRRQVRLARGDVLIWPADCFWVHEVLPVRRGVRYSVNSFLTSIPEAEKERLVGQLGALPATAWQTPYRHTLPARPARAERAGAG